MRSSRPIVLSLARARDPLHHLEPAHAGHASIRPVPSEGVLIKLQAVFVVIVIAALAGSQTSEVHAQADYTLFESGPVRPVAMSPDGNRVFVTNTPDGYLEIFDVSGGFAAKGASVPVGLEPVAVAARNDDTTAMDAIRVDGTKLWDRLDELFELVASLKSIDQSELVG